jgi:hypothetical protein
MQVGATSKLKITPIEYNFTGWKCASITIVVITTCNVARLVCWKYPLEFTKDSSSWPRGSGIIFNTNL